MCGGDQLWLPWPASAWKLHHHPADASLRQCGSSWVLAGFITECESYEQGRV